MPVRRLLREIRSDELSEWMALYRLERKEHDDMIKREGLKAKSTAAVRRVRAGRRR